MKKIVLFLLFICFFVKPIIAQPISDDMNYTRVNLAFYNCKKDTILFVKEKNKIKSNDNKYFVEFVEMENNRAIKNINYYSSIHDNYNLKISYKSFDEDKKKVLKVNVYKKKKKMVILFRIYKQSKPYIPWDIEMFLYFKKGTYEVTDPENPKLVKIKMKKIEYGL